MTTLPSGASSEGSAGTSQVQLSGESRDSSMFTQIGIQNNVQQVPAEAFRWAELAVPPGLGNLPGGPGLFVGRAAELARLDVAVAAPGQLMVQVVHGLGGIGKSTLAARWAGTHASDYTLTWWITADTRTGIDAGLASLAVALQPALSGILPLEALREGALQWLAAHQEWLLILDNVTDPADAAPLLARTPAGRYLITTRRATGWHATATPIGLGVLNPAEAEALLTSIPNYGQPRELDGASELCAELGYLPLAVEQAGAYLAQADVTPRQYLGLLSGYPADMYRDGEEGRDDARTIARIWDVTLDRLADEPLAGQILRILSWYAPEAIPRALLDGLATPPALTRAVGRLAAYSMLTTDAGFLAVHRLVQAVTRIPEPGDPHRDPLAIADARGRATRQLAIATPANWQDPASWPNWRTLLPHIEALASHAPPDADTQTTAHLLNQAGVFLDEQGQGARAARYLQRAVTVSQRVLGNDHPDTMTTRNNLASAYQHAGDLSRAIPLGEQTLADRQRVLGEDHPDTLTSRNNLACAYQHAGDLSRAVPLYEQAFADFTRVLGEDHPLTLTSQGNLISAYQDAGDLDRAIPLYLQALADSVRVQGEDHPHTLGTLNNLAGAYQAAGDLNRALPLYLRAFVDSLRVLGEDHPLTLTSGNNLAGALLASGDLDQALPLFKLTLAKRQRVLGENHPDTLASRNNLAYAYKDAGDLDQAKPMLLQALADSVRVLGEDHPQTLTAGNNLASAMLATGDPGQAIQLFELTLAKRQQVLGQDHDDTLATRTNLAAAYRAAGHPDRAIPLYEQALADSARILGEDHPQTKIVSDNLAAARKLTSDLAASSTTRSAADGPDIP
jgi:tetratricopeptide (TPR) repeat protein